MVRQVLTFLCITGLAAGAGAVQQPPEQERPQQEQERPQQQRDPQVEKAGQQRDYVLSDELIGTEIETAEGETMTSIEQLIVSREDGQVKYVIADMGGFLGLGAREVAIPWNKLQLAGPERVTFSGTEEQLRNSPQFDQQEFLGVENLGEWERKIEGAFGAEGERSAQREQPAEERPEREQPEPAERTAEQQDRPVVEGETRATGGLMRPLILSDDLIGTNIENHQDEDLGEVEQLLIDVASGRAAYVVADVGGFLGVTGRQIAIPWKSLQFTGAEEITLAGTADLSHAPHFDEREFLDMEDVSDWEREVDEFFKVQRDTNR